jgi:hypothetical protein
MAPADVSCRGGADEGTTQRRAGGTGSRRKACLLVAAVVGAGVIDGVVRVHLGMPSWDASDALLQRNVRWSAGDSLQLGLSNDERRRESLWQTGTYGEVSVDLGGVQRERDAGQTQSTETLMKWMLKQHDIGAECTHQFDCKTFLVCNDEGKCSACDTDEQCQVRNDQRQCFANTERDYNVCKHKPLFLPFSFSDFVLAVITFLTTALAAPTGAGGGGILVPMFMMIGQFAAHSAVPLSKASILGGAIANNFINIQRRHPFANRPVVDFDALQLLVPNLLAGAILGVFINAVAPDWLLTVGLIGALGYSGWNAAKKAWSLYAEEMGLQEVRPLLAQTGGNKDAKKDDSESDHFAYASQKSGKHYSYGRWKYVNLTTILCNFTTILCDFTTVCIYVTLLLYTYASQKSGKYGRWIYVRNGKYAILH